MVGKEGQRESVEVTAKTGIGGEEGKASKAGIGVVVLAVILG